MTDEELKSEMVKIALDASKEGYRRGILASSEFLRKTASAELNQQNAEILNTYAQVLEDIIEEEMK